MKLKLKGKIKFIYNSIDHAMVWWHFGALINKLILSNSILNYVRIYCDWKKQWDNCCFFFNLIHHYLLVYTPNRVEQWSYIKLGYILRKFQLITPPTDTKANNKLRSINELAKYAPINDK